MISLNIVLLDGETTEEGCMYEPETRIKYILEDICQKYYLDPSKFALSYNNYILSENLVLKTLILSDNDTWKLIEDFRPTINDSVKVILRIKDSNIGAFFHPDVTLWHVIKSLVASVTLSIDSCTPVLVRKNVEYIGIHQLSNITPRTLGVSSGNIRFRFSMIEDYVLSNRTTGILGSSESMHFELIKHSHSRDNTHKILPCESLFCSSEDTSVKFVPGITRRGTSVFEEINYLGDRNAVAFRLPKQHSRPKRNIDSFYYLAEEDILVMYRQLHSHRKILMGRFKNKIKKEDLDSEFRFMTCAIRIHFPDKTVLQGVFEPSDTIKDVEMFIMGYVRILYEFQLVIAYSKTVLESDKTLLAYNMVPNGTIHYKALKQEAIIRTAYLKEDVLRHLTTHEGACHAAALCISYFPIFDGSSSYMDKPSSDISADGKILKRDASISKMELHEKKRYTLRSFDSKRVINASCKKFSVNPDDYELRYAQKKLNPNVNLMFSNLPKDAFLELCPINNSQIKDKTVVVKLVEGEEVVNSAQFNVSDSLWEVSQKLLPKEKFLEDDRICISCLSANIIGQDMLKKVRLSSLKCEEGSLMISLNRQYSNEKLLDEDVQKSSEHDHPKINNPAVIRNLKGKLNRTNVQRKTEHVNVENTRNENKIPKDNKTMKTFSESFSKDISLLDKREIQTNFQRNIGTKLKGIASIDETFYLTEQKKLKDVKYLYSRKGIAYIFKNPITDDQSEESGVNLLNLGKDYTRTSGDVIQLKIVFPDQTAVKAMFRQEEKVIDVCNFLNPLLRCKKSDYFLYLKDPTQIIRGDMSLKELERYNTVTLFFGIIPEFQKFWSKSMAYLKDEYLPLKQLCPLKK